MHTAPHPLDREIRARLDALRAISHTREPITFYYVACVSCGETYRETYDPERCGVCGSRSISVTEEIA